MDKIFGYLWAVAAFTAAFLEGTVHGFWWGVLAGIVHPAFWGMWIARYILSDLSYNESFFAVLRHLV